MQNQNFKVEPMPLDKRTSQFARNVRHFVKKLPRTISNIEDAKQLVRSSGSIGANYIEANEAISKKDQIYRMKICRKETKETVFWLNNIEISINESYRDEWSVLINEAKELFLIFCAVVRKSS